MVHIFESAWWETFDILLIPIFICSFIGSLAVQVIHERRKKK